MRAESMKTGKKGWFGSRAPNELDQLFDQERAETIRTRSRWIWGGSIPVWITSLFVADLAVFTPVQALTIRIPDLALAIGFSFWLRRPRRLRVMEAATVFGWFVVASLSGYGFLIMPVDKLPFKVAALVLSVLVVCLLGSFTWQSTAMIAVLTVLSVSAIKYVGADSLYTVTLTVVGFAYSVLIVAAAARDRLKRAELEARHALTTANEKLQREDELRRRLFVNLSHDFRTPLAVVRGEAELLRSSGRFGADDAALGRVEANARALTDLVDQLLDLARLEAGQMPFRPRHCDIGAIAREVASLLQPSGHAERIVTVVPQMVVVAKIDPSHVRRILSNLVANGLRQVRTGGQVTIVVARDGTRVVVDVVDDGKGVPDALRESIFQRFVSLDSDGSTASGIGLPLARELALLNGGELEIVHPSPKTTFRLSILAVDEAPEEEVRGEATRPAPRTNGAPANDEANAAGGALGPRVLIVEDNPDMAALLCRVLGDRFRVEHVATVADALSVLRDRPPNAVLSDVLLPDGNGYDVLATVRGNRELERLPVVLVSALSEVDQRVRGLSAGADDYVSKPFAPEELRSRVTAAIDRAESRHRALEGQRDALLMEIHDGVSASLSRASILLSDPEGGPGDGESRDYARDAIQDGLDEVRAITRLLAPRPSDWQTLTAEIRRALADACAAASLILDFEADEDPDSPPLPAAVAHTLRRIAREATTNIVKHAHAKKITCRMSAAQPAWSLRVEDDGRGLPEAMTDGQGLGIMNRRATRIGGTVQYGNLPTAGAFVAAQIPRTASIR